MYDILSESKSRNEIVAKDIAANRTMTWNRELFLTVGLRVIETPSEGIKSA